jgi:hypothetical protein
MHQTQNPRGVLCDPSGAVPVRVIVGKPGVLKTTCSEFLAANTAVATQMMISAATATRINALRMKSSLIDLTGLSSPQRK